MNQSPSIVVERVRAHDDQRKRNQGQTFNGPAAAVICGELADQLEVTGPTLIWQERCSKTLPWLFLLSLIESRPMVYPIVSRIVKSDPNSPGNPGWQPMGIASQSSL
jgi:hypothetical protein